MHKATGLVYCVRSVWSTGAKGVFRAFQRAAGVSFPSRGVSTVQQDDVDPLSLVEIEKHLIYTHMVEILRRHLRQPDMFDIAHSYYTNLEDSCGVSCALMVLVTQALNHHVCGRGGVSPLQARLLAVCELFNNVALLRDDIYDNSRTRRGFPAAHVRWDRYRVTMAANATAAVCVGEAARLDPELGVVVAQLGETLHRGQLWPCRGDYLQGDMLTNYLEELDYKCGSVFRHTAEALTRTVACGGLLRDTLLRYTFNVGMGCALVDDIKDWVADLEGGTVTAPVILAAREHDALGEMMRRRFERGGDVEKAVELVRNSRGLEGVGELAKNYFNNAQRYLCLFADSPYKANLHLIFQLYLASQETINMDMEL